MSAGVEFRCPSAGSSVSAYGEIPMSVVNEDMAIGCRGDSYNENVTPPDFTAARPLGLRGPTD
jgi:hypothetical protein